MIRFLRLLLVAAALFAAAAPSLAQEAAPITETPVALPEPLTQEAIDGLIARLSDAQVRQLLLQQLESNAAVTEEASEPGLLVGEIVGRIVSGWGLAITRIADYPAAFAKVWSNFIDGRDGGEMSSVFGRMIGAFAIGIAAIFGFRLATSKFRQRVREARPERLWPKIGTLALRLGLDLASIGLFALGTYMAARALLPRENDQFVVTSIMAIIAVAAAFRAFAVFVFAPKRADLRLIKATDDGAAYIVRRFTLIGILGPAASYIIALTWQFGIAPGELRLGFWLNLALNAVVVATIWQGREGLPRILGSEDPDTPPIMRRLALAWPMTSLGLVLAIWIIVQIIVVTGNIQFVGPHTIYLTLSIILFMPIFDVMARSLVKNAYLITDDEGNEIPARKATRQSLTRIAQVIMAAILIIIITGLWSINISDLAEAGLGARFATALFDIIFIAIVAYLITEFLNIAINRALAKDAPEGGEQAEIGGEGGGPGGTRLETILPLLRGVVQGAIAVLAAFAMLSELGINITPLLAGAGVIGLAIGFGAQAFVQDVVSGLFFLIDDAFRIGEYIEVGQTRGTVEKISIRSLRLRHHRGPVHTLPYGQIDKLTNFSRDWAITKLRFRVPFDTDMGQVKRIFKQIGKDMLAHEEYGKNFIQQFKSQGVYEVDDSGMIIRGKFMTKPGTQFVIRREIFQRVQAAFEEAGIPFQRKEVRVHVPGIENVEDEELQKKIEEAAGAAASEEEPVTEDGAQPA